MKFKKDDISAINRIAKLIKVLKLTWESFKGNWWNVFHKHPPSTATSCLIENEEKKHKTFPDFTEKNIVDPQTAKGFKPDQIIINEANPIPDGILSMSDHKEFNFLTEIIFPHLANLFSPLQEPLETDPKKRKQQLRNHIRFNQDWNW